MNILDSLKKYFYKNGSSEASSDARIPLLTSTGEPKGSDTMANIASVLGAAKALSIPNGAPNLYRTFSFTMSDYQGSASFLLDVFDGSYLVTSLRWAGSGYRKIAIIQLTDTETDDINDFTYSVTDDGVFTVYFGYGSNVNAYVTPLGIINNVTVGTSATAGTHPLTKQNMPDFYKNYQNLGSLASALGVDNLVTSEVTQGLKYSVVVHGNETASIDNVKNILSSMFANPSNRSGVSIVQCVFSGGVCYTCIISHDGGNYFAAQIMAYDLTQPVYVRYPNGTWS